MMAKPEWTKEDALRWHELCSKDPDLLTTQEKIEGVKLAERVFEFLLSLKEKANEA